MNQMAGNLVDSGLYIPIAEGCVKNSPVDTIERIGGRIIEVIGARITGTGVVKTNIFQIHGAVNTLSQWAQITDITTLVNLTDMHADLWDGSVSVPLTKITGANLSGLPVGSIFSKTGLATSAFEIGDASAPIFFESASARRTQPFTVAQTSGVDTFIRFNYTTTDTPVDFKMNIYFTWLPINGGYIELVT